MKLEHSSDNDSKTSVYLIKIAITSMRILFPIQHIHVPLHRAALQDGVENAQHNKVARVAGAGNRHRKIAVGRKAAVAVGFERIQPTVFLVLTNVHCARKMVVLHNNTHTRHKHHTQHTSTIRVATNGYNT
jgi:hypothetical protein